MEPRNSIDPAGAPDPHAQDDATPPSAHEVEPPRLTCPGCDHPLTHRRTVTGGIRPVERWHYFECRSCGEFVYRDRTRKLRPGG